MTYQITRFDGGSLPGLPQPAAKRSAPIDSPASGLPGPGETADRSAAEAHDRVALALARELYASRQRRERFFNPDLFGEPVWDILLDLYVAAREGRRVPTTSACIGAQVPPTTALRWLRILESRGLVGREDDGRDGRRTFVGLTPRGVAAMEGVLDCFATALRSALVPKAPPCDQSAR